MTYWSSAAQGSYEKVLEMADNTEKSMQEQHGGAWGVISHPAQREQRDHPVAPQVAAEYRPDHAHHANWDAPQRRAPAVPARDFRDVGHHHRGGAPERPPDRRPAQTRPNGSIGGGHGDGPQQGPHDIPNPVPMDIGMCTAAMVSDPVYVGLPKVAVVTPDEQKPARLVGSERQGTASFYHGPHCKSQWSCLIGHTCCQIIMQL